MKEEFESMEDYWQNKLVDERKFYEEQLKTNDNQFKELENRMKEYDEELISLENDKLSTIDETSSLEYQVLKILSSLLLKKIILQVQEWEEEIALLRAQLDKKDQDQKNQILYLEDLWNQKCMSVNNEKSELERKYSALTKPCKTCCERENFQQNRGQTDLEKMWQKSKSQAAMSTFTPHIPLLQGAQGPMSLPIELVNNAQKEVRRLQELRRYIQEECDHLLLKKDRLKEEVGHQSSNSWHDEQSRRSLDAYLHNGDGYNREDKGAHSLWNVATGTYGSKKENCANHLYSDQPYKVVDKSYFLLSTQLF